MTTVEKIKADIAARDPRPTIIYVAPDVWAPKMARELRIDVAIDDGLPAGEYHFDRRRLDRSEAFAWTEEDFASGGVTLE